jgi:arginyl-tRNA synthetase
LHHLKKPRSFEQLVNQQELDLMNSILYFKHTIEMVATKYEVNKMTIFLFNLAKQFHAYYSNVKIIDENNYDLSMERLFLAKAIQQVIYNGLNLLGIVATEKM